MSFSLDIKKELSQINNFNNKKAIENELIGYLKSNNIVEEKDKIKFSTESEYNINRFAKILKNFDIDFSIEMQGKLFVVYIKNNQISNMLKMNVAKEEVRSFIRGIFLGSGSISNPENSYHLEFEIKNQEEFNNILEILKKQELNFKYIESSRTLYLKDGEEISKFLAFIGAQKSVIKFEEIRVKREMNNKINRIVNCKTANLNKVLNASVKQIDAIRLLKQTGKFEKLDENLKEIANLRLQYPDMSLIELGKKLKKPIGKSGVNYRLRKIIEIQEGK